MEWGPYIYDRLKRYQGHRIQFQNRKLSPLGKFSAGAIKDEKWPDKYKDILERSPEVEIVHDLITETIPACIIKIQDRAVGMVNQIYNTEDDRTMERSIKSFWYRYVNDIANAAVMSWLNLLTRYYKHHDSSARIKVFTKKVNLEGWFYAMFCLYWKHFYEHNVSASKSIYRRHPVNSETQRRFEDRIDMLDIIGHKMSEVVFPSTENEIAFEIDDELADDFEMTLKCLLRDDMSFIYLDKLDTTEEFLLKFNNINLFI